MERYARQQAIDGWDQSRLTEATLAVVGSGPTAFLAALMATAMGFGNVALFGCAQRRESGINSLDVLLRSSNKAWASLLRRVNPEVKIYPLQRRVSAALIGKLPNLGGVIVAGNDVDNLLLARELARETSFPVVAGGAAGAVGFWGVPATDPLTLRVCQHEEWPLMSQIIAGLLVDEIRKVVLPLSNEAGRTTERHLIALSRLPGVCEPEHKRPFRPHCDGLAVIGAGALGTWFGLATGMLGIRLPVHIYDDDTVEKTNLNRQVLFFDSVGKSKAIALASRLKALFPSIAINGYGMRVDEGTVEHVPGRALLAACPDNFAVRAFLNGVAGSRRAILISGGTSAMGGSSATYVPGHTSCLSCLTDIDRLAIQETHTISCTVHVETSVVTSNAITGALMAWSVRELLAGNVPEGIWEYDSRARTDRIGVHSTRPQCRCHLGAR